MVLWFTVAASSALYAPTCVSAPAPVLRQAICAPPRARRLVGNGLVIAQVAISVALLTVSQLSIAHLCHLRDRSLGFDRNRVLLPSVNTSRAETRAQALALYRDVVPRLQAIPGVRPVAASGITPIALGAASRFLQAEGFDEHAQDRRRAAMNWVLPDYFATYGTPLLAGRDSRDADFEQPRLVMVMVRDGPLPLPIDGAPAHASHPLASFPDSSAEAHHRAAPEAGNGAGGSH